MKARLRTLVAGPVIVGMLSLSTPSQACVPQCWAVDSLIPPFLIAIPTLTSSFVGALTARTTALVQLLREIDATWGGGFASWAGEVIKAGSAAHTDTGANVVTAGAIYSTKTAADVAAASMPPPMADTTAVNSKLLEEQSRIARQKLTRYNADFGQTLVSTTPAGPSALERHRPYCTTEDAKHGYCTKAAESTLQNADVLASTLFEPGDGQYDTYTDAEQVAARAYAQNLIAATPDLLPPFAPTTPAAQHLQTLMLVDQAALSAAANSLNAIIANRTRRNAP